MPREIAGGAGGVFRYTAGAKDPEAARLGVAIPVDLGSGLRLIVGRDIEDQRRFADEMGTLYFLGLGFLSLTGLLAGFLISRFALRRIEAINVATRSIMDGDLARRIPVSGSGDEFDVLATNFNAMLERIEALMNGLREVSDNIAHDLKTPLTRLRNSAEAALMDPRGPRGLSRRARAHDRGRRRADQDLQRAPADRAAGSRRARGECRALRRRPARARRGRAL